MKYLLNFIYKYDKLCYDEAKEITDPETKEEVIKTFYYITSEQYIYEHLFENDSFKGMQNLLKHVSNLRDHFGLNVVVAINRYKPC